MKEGICISKTSVYFYETTLRHIPEGCHFHISRCENLKSHSVRSKFFPELLAIRQMDVAILLAPVTNGPRAESPKV
jgi:hypothetical protein